MNERQIMSTVSRIRDSRWCEG